MKKKAAGAKRRGVKAPKDKIVKDLTPWERAVNEEEKARRNERQWTMTEAAAHCDVTRPSISQHEHQVRGMTVRTLVSIAKGYGLEPEDFLKHARRWLAQTTLWLLTPENEWLAVVV